MTFKNNQNQSNRQTAVRQTPKTGKQWLNSQIDKLKQAANNQIVDEIDTNQTGRQATKPIKIGQKTPKSPNANTERQSLVHKRKCHTQNTKQLIPITNHQIDR